MKGRVDELWAVVAAVSAARGGPGSELGKGGTEWAVVDEDGLQQIAAILGEQQAGLTHLTDIVKEMQKDLAVVLGEPRGFVAQERVPDVTMFGSTMRTSTLRS